MFRGTRVRFRNGPTGPARDRPERETGLSVPQVGRCNGGTRRGAPGRFATRRRPVCSWPAGCWSKQVPWTIRRFFHRADPSSPHRSATVMHVAALSRQKHCARAMLRVPSKLTCTTPREFRSQHKAMSRFCRLTGPLSYVNALQVGVRAF